MQFAERKVPILETLAEMLNVSTAEVLDMGSKSKLTSDIMIAAFEKMTAEGGRFNKAAERLSQTMSGKFSTLVSKISIAFAEMGESLSVVVKPALDSLIVVMDVFTGKFGEIAQTVAITTFAMGGLAASIKLLAGTKIAASLAGVVTAMKSIKIATIIATGKIAALIGVIVAAIAGMKILFTAMKNFANYKEREKEIEEELIVLSKQHKAALEKYVAARKKGSKAEMEAAKKEMDAIQEKFRAIGREIKALH